MNCMAYTYYVCYTNSQMHVYLIASFIKIINKLSTMFCRVPTQVSQDGFKLRFICIFLGCDLPMQLQLKSLSSAYDAKGWKIVFTVYRFMSWTISCVTFYTWSNRLTHFSTCILPIQLLLCVIIIVNKHLTISIIKY